MRARRPALVAVLLSVLVGAAWLLFAPTQLGGSTMYSSTVGTSMQPRFHKGDLALVRASSSYRVGDVVLYESPVLHRPVLHRILVVQKGRYYLKGDNNDFVDPGSIARKDILGKLWFRVPHGGLVIGWLGVPLHASILAAIAAAFLVLGGSAQVRRRRRRRRARDEAPPRIRAQAPARPLAWWARRMLRPRRSARFVGGAAALLLALVLVPVGFITPSRRTVQLPDAYRHSGTFSYTARVTGADPAYPTGLATTGEPLFLTKFETMRVRFAYRFASRLPHAVEGTIALRALISSDVSWKSLSVLSARTRFRGDTATTEGTIDLVSLRALIGQLTVDSGSVGGSYSIDLQPAVRVRGVVGGKKIAETFSPVLPLVATQSLVKLNVAASSMPPGATYAPPSAEATLAAALDPSQSGTVPARAANYVTIARYSLEVGPARGLGLGLGVLGLLLLASQAFQRRRDVWSNEKRIAMRFGCVVVDVGAFETGGPAGAAPFEVPDFASLATLARYCERPILRHVGDGCDTYAVQDDGRFYLHRARQAAAPADVSAAEPDIPLPSPPAGRRRRGLLRLAGVLTAIGIGATLVVGYTATNTVPLTHAGTSKQTTQPGQLAPTQCAGIVFTHVIVATSTSTTGTSGNDLILGKNAAGSFTYTGGGGDDCIVTGGGSSTTNTVYGGIGNDICIGSPQARNTFSSCAKTY